MLPSTWVPAWSRTYFHFRKNSILVSVGQTVTQGQILGLAGSSGSSTMAHLHFELDKNGVAVETYQNPSLYWANPLPYAGTQLGVLDSGVADHVPTQTEFNERPVERAAFAATAGQIVDFWTIIHGVKNGDQTNFTWYQPDGTVYTSFKNTPGELRHNNYHYYIGLPTNPQLGTWQIVVTNNGIPIATGSFLVSNDATQRFVAQTYRDLLHRPADTAGLAYWDNLLNGGLSHTAMIQQFQTSQEYRTNEIQNLYFSLLGYHADAAGLNYWLGVMNAGSTIEQVKASIFGGAIHRPTGWRHGQRFCPRCTRTSWIASRTTRAVSTGFRS